MFLQIHALTSYPASLLNRDDAGLAKRIPFGNATRLRVSSQCLKRHWRLRLQEVMPDVDSGFRTRHFFGRAVLPLVIDKGVALPLAKQLTSSLAQALFEKKKVGASSGKKKGKAGKEEPADTEFADEPTGKGTQALEPSAEGVLEPKQPILFGRPEAQYFASLIAEAAVAGDAAKSAEALEQRLASDAKQGNLDAMLAAAGNGNLFAGLEGAMFGRFVTSDRLARSDASVHVAHAFTVHPAETEVDYFTVVDDLGAQEESGAAHAGDMELGAGLYYLYVVVDVPLLMQNITGCAKGDWKAQDSTLAQRTIGGLVEAVSTVSPGAKLGPTAPYARADFVLLEAGIEQPRSLANAFLAALPQKGDPMQSAVDALIDHMTKLDAMYGKGELVRVAASTRRLEKAGDLPVAPLNDAVNTVLIRTFA